MRSHGGAFPSRCVIGFLVALSLALALSGQGLRPVGANKGRGPLPQAAAHVAAARPEVVAADVPSDAKERGTWSAVRPMRDVPIHTSVLPDGRVLYWGRDKFADKWDAKDKCNTFLWDPLYPDVISQPVPNTTNDLLVIPNGDTNLFCSGHSFLQDGKLLVTGGHTRHPDPAKPDWEGVGETDVNIFDYKTNTWSLLKDTSGTVRRLKNGRWYPYNLTLANGETFVVSGSYYNDTRVVLNVTPEVIGLDGSVRDSTTDANLFPLTFTNTYPYIHLAPDGRVFYAGSPGDTQSRFLDLSVSPNRWDKGGSLQRFHDVGTSVLYAPGAVLVVGGRSIVGNQASQPIADTETTTIGVAAAAQAWGDNAKMSYPRIHPNSTLLPDGRVFVVGGVKCPGANNVVTIYDDSPADNCFNGEVLTPEIWDPQTNVWQQTAPHAVIRAYHSTAVLLPDARVLVGGGGLPVAEGEMVGGSMCLKNPETDKLPEHCRLYGHKDAEIFFPPYLYESDGGGGSVPVKSRPAITHAPASAAYAREFNVGVGNVSASEVAGVVLVRLPSVTHSNAQDQRRVVLNFTPAADGRSLAVTAPADGNECPPGPYMMFLLKNNEQRTPSVAKIIRVGELAIDKTSQVLLSGSSLTGSINVAAAPGVGWTASVNAEASSWLTITSGGSGTGSGVVSFTAASNAATPANLNPARRKGTIIISVAGRKFSAHDFAVYQAADFNDVAPGSTYYAAISKLSARAIVSGCGQNSFCPTNPVTRAQMAVLLTGALGATNVLSPDTPRFTDVPKTHAAYRPVEYLVRRGVTGGCGDRKFCPDAVVTREQMATFIVIALGVTSPPPVVSPSFSDVLASSAHAPFIEELVRRGITGGCGNGKFCPDQPVTREQAAALLSAAFNL